MAGTLLVMSLPFWITILRLTSSSELKSKVRFEDASLMGKFEILPGHYFDGSANTYMLYEVKSRSKVECGRACLLSTDCAAANFYRSGKVCTLFTVGVANMVKTPIDGWDVLLNKKVNFHKGWLGLVDGPNERRGRTEAFLQGQWGSICDSSYTLTGWPQTFCADMGYTGIIKARYAINQPEGVGTGYVAWQGPVCTHPNDLTQCLQSSHNCGHNKDVVVECKGGK